MEQAQGAFLSLISREFRKPWAGVGGIVVVNEIPVGSLGTQRKSKVNAHLLRAEFRVMERSYSSYPHVYPFCLIKNNNLPLWVGNNKIYTAPSYLFIHMILTENWKDKLGYVLINFMY